MALSVLPTGTDRPLPPAAPTEHEQTTGLAPRASTSLEQVTQTLRIGTSNPKSALGVVLLHGIEGMVERGSRGQLELVRAGSELPPSMGLDQPP